MIGICGTVSTGPGVILGRVLMTPVHGAGCPVRRCAARGVRDYACGNALFVQVCIFEPGCIFALVGFHEHGIDHFAAIAAEMLG